MTKKFLSKILNEFRTKDFLENSQYYNELSPRMKKVVGAILTNIDEKDLIKGLDNKIKESVIKYKISEKDLQNYIEMYDWLTALGFPREFSQFAALKEPEQASRLLSKYSDLTIVLHTNKSNPNYRIRFTDCFPTSLSSIGFDATPTGMDPIVVDATYQFRGQFDIEKIV